MIEEADDVDNGLILRILGHSLNKGEAIKYLHFLLIFYMIICYTCIFVAFKQHMTNLKTNNILFSSHSEEQL
jgi:uncharacterized protein (DUF2225 family)